MKPLLRTAKGNAFVCLYIGKTKNEISFGVLTKLTQIANLDILEMRLVTFSDSMLGQCEGTNIIR